VSTDLVSTAIRQPIADSTTTASNTFSSSSSISVLSPPRQSPQPFWVKHFGRAAGTLSKASSPTSEVSDNSLWNAPTIDIPPSPSYSASTLNSGRPPRANQPLPRPKKKNKAKKNNDTNMITNIARRPTAEQHAAAPNGLRAPVPAPPILPNMNHRQDNAPNIPNPQQFSKLGVAVRGYRENKSDVMLALTNKLATLLTLPNTTEDSIYCFLFLPALSHLPLQQLRDLLPRNDIVLGVRQLLDSMDVPHPQAIAPAAGDAAASEKAVQSKIKKLIKANRTGSATQRLEQSVSSVKPASMDDAAVREAILRLHPAATEADILPVPTVIPSAAIVIPPPMLDLTVQQLVKESGAGVSPWTNELIKLWFQSSPEAKASIKDMLEHILNGRMAHSGLWLRSRLIALEKSPGKYRPIAVADPWMRLVGKIASKLFCDQANNFLGPTQLGLKVKGGSEVIVHATKLVVDQVLQFPEDDLCVVTLDCSNAFNSLRRGAIQDGVEQAVPGLLNFFRWSYGQPVDLMSDFRTPRCQSQTGVRQGDPLGPMFFDLGISSALKSVANEIPNITILSYQDDTYVIGRSAAVRQAVNFIKTRLQPLGLSFNDDKGLIFCSRDTVASLRAVNIPTSVDGFVAMGIPVGSRQYILDHLARDVENQTKILAELRKFTSPEAFAILKQCVAARPTHCVRGVDPTLTADYAKEFDTRINGSLALLANIPTGLSDTSLRVKSLPAQFGGLGMRSLDSVREEAWSASWLSSLKYINQHLPQIFRYLPAANYDPGVIDRCLEAEIEKLPPPPPTNNLAAANVRDGTPTAAAGPAEPLLHHHHVEHVVTPLVQGDFSIPSQHVLCSKHDKRKHDDLLNDLRANNQAPLAAWLLSSSTHGTASWLHSACTEVAGLHLSDEAFQDGIRAKLLVTTFQDPPGILVRRRCTSCRDHDIEPLHALSCRMASNVRISRHNFVRDALAQFIKAVEPDARLSLEYHMVDGRRERRRGHPAPETLRADIKVELNGTTTFIDVAVVNPSSNSATSMENGSSVVVNAAAVKKENDKLSKYRTAYSEEVARHVIPFVVEATGRLGPRAAACIEQFSKIGVPNLADDVRARAMAARRFFSARLGKFLVVGNHKLWHHGRQFYREIQEL
jgi:hypothetical protein